MTMLRNKYALVTGSGKGIGRGIALALAESGANLFLHYRSDKKEADSLKIEIKSYGVEAHIFSADLANETELKTLYAKIKQKWGKLDIAVNNAGWDPGYIDIASINSELYYKLTDVNIKGTLFCCLHEIELMRNNPNGGSIINVGSVQQETTVPGRTLYAMSKGAIHSLTGQLALECGPLNIRVNNIAPGYIEVDRMSKNKDYDAEKVAAGIPRGRVGNVQDVGALATFLASSSSDFLTGQTLTVDGGVSRKLARN